LYRKQSVSVFVLNRWINLLHPILIFQAKACRLVLANAYKQVPT
jgi:hypothetical protein